MSVERLIKNLEAGADPLDRDKAVSYVLDEVSTQQENLANLASDAREAGQEYLAGDILEVRDDLEDALEVMRAVNAYTEDLEWRASEAQRAAEECPNVGDDFPEWEHVRGTGGLPVAERDQYSVRLVLPLEDQCGEPVTLDLTYRDALDLARTILESVPQHAHDMYA